MQAIPTSDTVLMRGAVNNFKFVILKRRNWFAMIARQRCVTNAKTLGMEEKPVSKTMTRNIQVWESRGAQCVKFKLNETSDAIK